MATTELFDLLDKGGLLVWPILLCSMLGMTIFFERLLHYRKVGRYIDRKTYESVFGLVREGQIEKARKQINSQDHKHNAASHILIEALSIDEPDRETLELVLFHGVDREISSLARYLSTLGVLASTAPLLGLLGTVVGMIKAFIVVETMGGSVNASVLAGGIWEAMLTTAMGLLVAIPLLFCHNHLEGRLRTMQQILEDISIEFIKAWSRHLAPRH